METVHNPMDMTIMTLIPLLTFSKPNWSHSYKAGATRTELPTKVEITLELLGVIWCSCF